MQLKCYMPHERPHRPGPVAGHPSDVARWSSTILSRLRSRGRPRAVLDRPRRIAASCERFARSLDPLRPRSAERQASARRYAAQALDHLTHRHQEARQDESAILARPRRGRRVARGTRRACGSRSPAGASRGERAGGSRARPAVRRRRRSQIPTRPRSTCPANDHRTQAARATVQDSLPRVVVHEQFARCLGRAVDRLGDRARQVGDGLRHRGAAEDCERAREHESRDAPVLPAGLEDVSGRRRG